MSEKIGDGGCVNKIVAESDEQVDVLMGALIELHQRRWTDVGETGSYADRVQCDFVTDVGKEFLREGRLYLTAIEHEDRIVGAEMNLIGENGILYSYSAGYDIEAASLEPGRIIGVDTLMELYRRDLVGIDYMRGDEAYKQRLATCSRKLLRMRAVAPIWLPRLRHAAWCTHFEVKQWMRRKTGRPAIDVLDITCDPNTSGQLSTSE